MKQLQKPRTIERGFALIATISIMVLLVMIALAMLSLSTIELRANKNEKAMAGAQANARMALMLAIGELQKELGPDQRISAAARILEPEDNAAIGGSAAAVAHPMWLGVWDSWDNWLNAKGIEETYTRGRESRFRRWLVSHPNQSALEAIDFAESSGGVGEVISMVGEGSLGTGADASLQVSVPKLALDTGAYAWWIGGENQKARLAASESPENDAELLHRRSQWPGSGSEILDGLEQLPASREVLKKMPTLSMLGVAGNDPDLRDTLKGHFHDLSTDAVGDRKSVV